LTVHLKSGTVDYSNPTAEDWNVSLVDTGPLTMTGGRLLRLKSHVIDEGTFMLTYGDGVSNIDIKKLLEFHRSHGKIATVSAVRPPVRFGELLMDGQKVSQFQEKPQAGEGWINGGFFVFETGVFDFIKGDETLLERDPLEKLAEIGELMAYHHPGFWQCMDTIRDRDFLQNAWERGNAPWLQS
jgi:glucose-1-phosphate cytidylyltransferase